MESYSHRKNVTSNSLEVDVVKLKLLITGASGLVGYKTAQLALEKSHEVYSAYNEHQIKIGTPIKLDITSQRAVSETISREKPEAIIHTAAYTNVDGCDINRDLAWKVNAEATKYIAKSSAEINAHLTYVSTDYIFDGEKGLYSEEDSPNPINHYGYTKLKGEEMVRKHSREWCIARTSVVYGWGKTKLNFATWIITNLRQGKEVKIITDQYVSPTLNINLAEMLLEIVERKITDIIHTAGATRISRFKFSTRLAEVFNLNINLVKPTSMDEMSWKAERPRDSSLNVNKALMVMNRKPLKLNQALEIMKTKTK